MRSLNIYFLSACFCCLLLLQACFTGIESTPRITASDVKRENITVQPEAALLADIAPEAPRLWCDGKLFYATDPRIALIFTSDTPIDTLALAGTDLVYRGMRGVKSILGYDVALIQLDTPSGQCLSYKTEVPYASIDTLGTLDIPFAIDRDLVNAVDQRLRGKKYYITTPMWYQPTNGAQVTGLRHVPVVIDEVAPGNSVYPLSVIFSPEGVDWEGGPSSARKAAVYMTLGTKRTSTRNFESLFAFDNPRRRYPHITDDTWDLIIHSKVKVGMTPDECRLALGAPTMRGQRPTTAGMVEYWTYAEGIYLLFEDGLLATYRR